MNSVSMSKHTSFYIDTITFRVEDCLYRVPREPFATESIVFKDMFLLPTEDDHKEEGKSDDSPIRLIEIKKEEFEQLLSVLFHRSNGTSQMPLPETAAQWKSVLKLANMWGFSAIRKIAIRNLQFKLAPVEKIALGELYNLDFESWLLPAMQDLVRRQEPISLEEGLQLGLDTALKLASVRERISYSVQTPQMMAERGALQRRSQLMAESTVSAVVGTRANVQSLDFTKDLREIFACPNQSPSP